MHTSSVHETADLHDETPSFMRLRGHAALSSLYTERINTDTLFFLGKIGRTGFIEIHIVPFARISVKEFLFKEESPSVMLKCSRSFTNRACTLGEARTYTPK